MVFTSLARVFAEVTLFQGERIDHFVAAVCMDPPPTKSVQRAVQRPSRALLATPGVQQRARAAWEMVPLPPPRIATNEMKRALAAFCQ